MPEETAAPSPSEVESAAAGKSPDAGETMESDSATPAPESQAVAANAPPDAGLADPGDSSEASEAAVSVQPVAFSPLQEQPSEDTRGESYNGTVRSLSMLQDVPLQITVELGRTQMPVREVLDLRHGSVVELERLAGEPVDVRVNDRLIARGEVVVIEDKFGIRVLEIVSDSDRAPALQLD